MSEQPSNEPDPDDAADAETPAPVSPHEAHRARSEEDLSHLLARVPRYALIADDITQQIGRGDLAPGDPIPSETQMMQTYGVSRLTARRAVQELRTHGLVITEHGKTSRVRPHPTTVVDLDLTLRRNASPPPADRDAAETDVTGGSGVDVWGSDLDDETAWENAGTDRHRSIAGEHATALGSAEDAPVLRVAQNLTHATSGVRVVRSVVIRLATLATLPGLAAAVRPADVYTALSQETGVAPSVSYTVGALVPSPALAHTLGIDPATPVLAHTRTLTTPAGERILDITLAPADRIRIVHPG